MPESNVIRDQFLKPLPGPLEAVRSQLKRARNAEARPVEWPIRLEGMRAVVKAAPICA